MLERHWVKAKRLDGNGEVTGFLCPPTYPGFCGNNWYVAVEDDWKYGFNGKIWLYEPIDIETIEPFAVNVLNRDKGYGCCPNCTATISYAVGNNGSTKCYCIFCGQRVEWI